MENPKKKSEFIQEYLYAEVYPPEPPKYKPEMPDQEEENRGVIIIDIF